MTPYTVFEPHHLASARGLEVYNVPGLGRGEAGGMFEVYARKGWGGKGERALFILAQPDGVIRK